MAKLLSKNTSDNEYTSLKGTPLAPKDSVFAQKAVSSQKRGQRHSLAPLTLNPLFRRLSKGELIRKILLRGGTTLIEIGGQFGTRHNS